MHTWFYVQLNQKILNGLYSIATNVTADTLHSDTLESGIIFAAAYFLIFFKSMPKMSTV